MCCAAAQPSRHSTTKSLRKHTDRLDHLGSLSRDSVTFLSSRCRDSPGSLVPGIIERRTLRNVCSFWFWSRWCYAICRFIVGCVESTCYVLIWTLLDDLVAPWLPLGHDAEETRPCCDSIKIQIQQFNTYANRPMISSACKDLHTKKSFTFKILQTSSRPPLRVPFEFGLANTFSSELSG